MASIRKIVGKRGVSWEARMRIHGKMTSKTFKSKSDAKEWAAQVELGMVQLKRGPKLVEIVEEKAPTLTQDYARQAYRKLIELAGHLYPHEVGRPEVHGIYNHLLNLKKQVGQRRKEGIVVRTMDQTVSVGTANRQFAAMSALFGVLMREGVIDSNPFLLVKKKSENNVRTRFLRKEEVPKFMSALNEHSSVPFKTLVRLALMTGMRASSLLEIRWKDIDFEDRIVQIRKTKNGRPHACPLTKEVCEELISRKGHDEDLVISVDGQKSYTYRPSWVRFTKAIGMPDLRFHDLRRTVGSWLAMSGANDATIRNVLGHLSPEMAKRYQHLAAGHTNSVVLDVMGEALKNK